MGTRPPRRPRRGIAALLAALLCAGCFEFDAPVEEKLEIFFHADGSVEIGTTTLVRPPWQNFEGHAAVQDRLDELRNAIRQGEDLWSRALSAMEPRRERVVWEYESGDLVKVQRQAYAEDPRVVESLFALTPVSALVTWEGDAAEAAPLAGSSPGPGPSNVPAIKGGTLVTLELVPSTAGLATQRQVRQAEEALAAFADAVAAHLDALAALYSYLETHPGLRRWAMALLVDEKAEPPADEAQSAEEAALLIEDAGKAMEAFLKTLEVAEGEAYTLDEISRLVHDPFPAPVFVEVTGEIEEVVGFLPGEARGYTTRRHSLWDAFESLEGRWVSPIPAVAWLRAIRKAGNVDTIDMASLVEELSSRPLSVRDVPDAEMVQEALLEQMTPPALYLLRWRLPE